MRRAMVAVAGHTAATDEPPDAPPTSPSTFNYEGNKVGVQWVNGDTQASTQTGFTAGLDGIGGEPTSVHATTSPGQTQQLTNETDACVTWFVRHSRNGQVTGWVEATAGHSTAGCGPE